MVDVTSSVIGAALLLFLMSYLGVLVLGRRRGRSWPLWRTMCAVAGVLACLVALGPLGAAGHHDFVAHMWGHLLLGMLGPLLLVLASPVTAALRGLPVPVARQLTALLGTMAVRVLSHPAVAAVLNIGGLWLLYTTAAQTWMHSSTLGHLLIHLHVLLAGWLFTAAVLQVDPTPHPVSHAARAVVLVAFLALHAILSKHLYAHPPEGVEAAEARAGAQVMYYGGDYIDLALIVLFCLDWYRRTAPRAQTRGGWAPAS
ncbi:MULTISPECIES: cytochrome c oxidase assembly protein [unclassified Serinicoccus]|uniref:cytochrome c oxidase assembly protein n=1 Tax=unclassified Serinicoccus TaxID=2643101 RepID=UPI0038528200